MSLGKKLDAVKSTYHVIQESDWSHLSPAEVLQVPGVGESTLLKLRLYLAHRGINLRGDLEPEYWLTLDRKTKAGEEFIRHSDFTILVDVNETYDFTFAGMVDQDDKPIHVRTRKEALWSKGYADYTIEGFEKDIQIERKADDLASSLAGRRSNFEDEIARLDGMCEFAAIVSEYDWRIYFDNPTQFGASNQVIHRTWLSWSIRYPHVHWFFCAGRDHAELVTWQLLQRAHSHITHRRAKDALARAQLLHTDPLASL